MSLAKEYLDLFKTTCRFHIPFVEMKDGRTIRAGERVCGQPAVAVYVSADEQHEARYVCRQHAEEAEAHGDGPVFWQRGPLRQRQEQSVAYDHTGRVVGGIDESEEVLPTHHCVECGRALFDNWPYAACKTCGQAPCRHGNKHGECNQCDVEGDLAYDAAKGN